MSLLSLLFAFTVERNLPSKVWQFSYYFSQYFKLLKQSKMFATPLDSPIKTAVFIALPVLVTFLAGSMVEHTIFELVLSCVVLLICIGCHVTRERYKTYLQSAFKGETANSELEYQQLIKEKHLPDIGFGQALIWLNYRYFIAIMLIFVFFGLSAVVLYRMVISVINYQVENDENIDVDSQQTLTKALHIVDWPMVRIVAFGYMLVGNFSKALATWLDSCFDFTKQPYLILSAVAKQSEDFQLNENDCTAEPCLLVRLAKRTLLLLLSVIAILTITGVIQ